MSLPIPGLRPIAVFWGGLLLAGSAGAIALQSLGAPAPAPANPPPAALAAASQTGLVNEAADPLAGAPVAAAPAAPAPAVAPAALPLPPAPVAAPPMLAKAATLPALRTPHAIARTHHAHPAPQTSLARRNAHRPEHLARRAPTTTTTVVAEVPSYSAGSVQYRSYPGGWRPYYAQAYPPPPPYYVAPYRGYYAAY